jgi:protein TonB
VVPPRLRQAAQTARPAPRAATQPRPPAPAARPPAAAAPAAPAAQAQTQAQAPAGEAPPSAANAPGFGRVEGGVTRGPERLEQRPIAYPAGATSRGEQGTVMLRLQVDAAGRVAAAEIVTSSGYRSLDQAAQEAAQGWRFRPATRDGQPVASVVRAPVTFRLENAR